MKWGRKGRFRPIADRMTSLVGAMVHSVVVHAVVDQVPSPDVWTEVGSIATVAAALAAAAAAFASGAAARYTAGLAKSTELLAVETGKTLAATLAANRAEDRRHQEALQPHIALAYDRDGEREAIYARNVGPGFARNVTYNVKPSSPIVGASYPTYQPLRPLAIEPGAYKPIVYIGQLQMDIELEYFDAFGNKFHTVSTGFPKSRDYVCEMILKSI